MGDAAEAEDLWHVRMGPTDVKKLTLEQLDDLFRLDVISADTQVWQPGMDEWLPLSVVAGLGDDEPEAISIQVSERPAAMMSRQTSTAWPPVVAQREAAQSSWPPPVSRPASPPMTTRPPPPSAAAMSTRPPPPSARSNPPLSDAMSSWPPDAAWSDPGPRQAVSPYAATAAAYAPLGSPRLEDTAPRARVGGSGAWIIVLSLIVGLTITLYRNAVVHAAASSMGQSASYLKLEAALGGPGFGTPRAVDTMTARRHAQESTVSSSSLTAPPSTPTSQAAPAPAPAPVSEPKPLAEATPSPKAAAPAVAPPRPSPAAAPRGGGSPSPAPDNVFKTPKKGKKGGASDYDPLNPTL